MTSKHDPKNKIPALAAQAVLSQHVEKLPDDTPVCRGHDFEKNGLDLISLLDSMKTTGMQATSIGLAVDEVNKMIKWRLSDEKIDESNADEERDPEKRANTRCTIFLGYTSNMISSGGRELIKFLVKHNMVDAIVTTGGGIEEDFMKCLAPHYMGDFHLEGKKLRKKGLNRIGNLIVPNTNYCLFEDWLSPILDQMLKDQREEGTVWTPCKMIHRLGREIANEDSVYYWCWKNDIPVFCPAITDGSVGDMIYFMSYRNPGLVLDIGQDIRLINETALTAPKSGMVILGGGLIKHHICNANLMRNGADFSLFVNTAHAWDGSDAGADPDEAISWGKIKLDATPVKVSADFTIAWPLIMAGSFVRNKDLATKPARRPLQERFDEIQELMHPKDP